MAAGFSACVFRELLKRTCARFPKNRSEDTFHSISRRGVERISKFYMLLKALAFVIFLYAGLVSASFSENQFQREFHPPEPNKQSKIRFFTRFRSCFHTVLFAQSCPCLRFSREFKAVEQFFRLISQLINCFLILFFLCSFKIFFYQLLIEHNKILAKLPRRVPL